MVIKPVLNLLARRAPAALLVAWSGIAAADVAVDFDAGSHVLPAGFYDTVTVQGTASVQIGDDVEVIALNILSSDASVQVTGGRISVVRNFGGMQISGGVLSFNVFAFDSGTIDISAGTVATTGNLTGRDQSVINYGGGTLGDSAATVLSERAVFNWSGGAMSTSFILSGQTTWNIFGTSFSLGGIPFEGGDTVKRDDPAGIFGPFSNRDYDMAVLRATLLDGSTDVVQVLVSTGRNSLIPAWTGAINFAAAPVPEPGTWVSMLGGLAALAGLARRRADRSNRATRQRLG